MLMSPSELVGSSFNYSWTKFNEILVDCSCFYDTKIIFEHKHKIIWTIVPYQKNLGHYISVTSNTSASLRSLYIWGFMSLSQKMKKPNLVYSLHIEEAILNLIINPIPMHYVFICLVVYHCIKLFIGSYVIWIFIK